MQDKYYINQLYPLQDKVLALIANLPVDFYLTGGTALSRAYYNHRFSDDLDFFLNWSPNFSSQFQIVYNALKVFDISLGVKSESFARCFISKNDIVLKLDFVNDVSYRRDAPINTNLFCRTDCVANILSNKISAISRNEPKDIADIIEISQYYSFNWVEIFNDAKKKDLNVDELDVAQYIAQFDCNKLSQVNWIKTFDIAIAKQNLKVISHDIFNGSNNSLFRY